MGGGVPVNLSGGVYECIPKKSSAVTAFFNSLLTVTETHMKYDVQTQILKAIKSYHWLKFASAI